MKYGIGGRIKIVNNICAKFIHAPCEAAMHRREVVNANGKRDGKDNRKRGQQIFIKFEFLFHRKDYKAK